MAANFRSALHGFNRSDVVQFIQSQTMEHERALRVQKEEISRLQCVLDAMRRDLEQCQAEKAALEAQLAAKETSEPEEAEAISALDAPMASPVSAASAAPSDFNELELAAYRRAELTERMARERSAAAEERMKAIFAQADEKLLLTAQDMSTVLASFRSDFEQMQQLLSAAQQIVCDSSESLKAASELCSEG